MPRAQVATVDDQVAGLEVREQPLDEIVHRKIAP
jgi:hypothetical protein